MKKVVYSVDCQVESIHGGIPADKKMLVSFCEFKGMDKEQVKEMVETAPPNPNEDSEEKEEIHRTSFRQDNNGLFLAAHQVKKCMEEVQQSSGMWKRQKGDEGSLKQIMQHLVSVLPKFIYLRDVETKEVIKEPHSVIEMRAPVDGPKGKRNIIKFHDVIDKALFSFDIHFFEQDTKVFTKEKLIETLERIQVNGLGTNRRMGNGRFKVLKVAKRIEETEGITIEPNVKDWIT